MTTPSPTSIQSARDQTLGAVLASRARPRRPGALSASLTFGWRALLKLEHGPEQLLDVIAIPIIFTVMFTYLFGGALSGSTGRYLQFLLPGTLVMAVLLVTIYAGIVLKADISTGVSDRFRSLPIWRPAPIVGALIGDAGRYLLASSLVLVLGLVMGFRPAGGMAGVLLAVALVLAFAFSLSWIWTALALIVRAPSAVMSVGTTVLFPMTLGSNVFVNPHTMPSWLQGVITVNPVTHLVTAVRGLMAGTVAAGQVEWVLLACVVITAVFAPTTMYLYREQT